MFDMIDDVSIPRRPQREKDTTPLSDNGESCKTCRFYFPNAFSKDESYGECMVAPPFGNQLVVHQAGQMIKRGEHIDLRNLQLRPRTRAIDFCSLYEESK